MHPHDIGLQVRVEAGPERSFEVVSAQQTQYRSLSLRGSGWPERGQRGHLVLSNAVEEPRLARLTVRGPGRPHFSALHLGPGETLSLELPPGNAPFLVDVESASGLPGELSGGILWSGALGVPAGYQPLNDPATRASSNLTATALYGVGRRQVQQDLLLQNAGPEPLTVQARLLLEQAGVSWTESENEIRTLWVALETEGRVIQGLYRFLLATAQRSEETRLMKWADIDGDIWSIPAENTKPGRAHTEPLSPQAVAILEPLRELGSPYVFPSPSPRAKGRPVEWLSKATSRLREKCGFDFRPHDLRWTAATMLADLGTPEETLRKLLNHKSGSTGVTAIYDRADRRADVRRALFAWGAKLERIISGEAVKVARIG